MKIGKVVSFVVITLIAVAVTLYDSTLAWYVLAAWVVAAATILLSGGSQPQVEDGSLVEQAPIIKLVNALIQQAIMDGATLVTIEPHPRMLKVIYAFPDGRTEEAMTIPKNLQPAIVKRLKIMAEMATHSAGAQAGRIEVRNKDRDYDLKAEVYLAEVTYPDQEKMEEAFRFSIAECQAA